MSPRSQRLWLRCLRLPTFGEESRQVEEYFEGLRDNSTCTCLSKSRVTHTDCCRGHILLFNSVLLCTQTHLGILPELSRNPRPINTNIEKNRKGRGTLSPRKLSKKLVKRSWNNRVGPGVSSEHWHD